MRPLLALAVLCAAVLCTAVPSARAQSVRYRMERVRVDSPMAEVYDVRLPRLTSGATPAVRRVVNARLDSIAARYTCPDDDDPEAAARDTYQSHVRSTVRRTGPRYFSVAVAASTSCGGPHPWDVREGYTFDLSTGALLTFEAVFGTDEATLTALTEEAYRDAARRVRQDSLRAVRRGRPVPCVDPGMRGTGEMTAPMPVQAYVLTPQSVEVWPHLSHAAVGCTVVGAVSFAQARRYVRPGSPLARLH